MGRVWVDAHDAFRERLAWRREYKPVSERKSWRSQSLVDLGVRWTDRNATVRADARAGDHDDPFGGRERVGDFLQGTTIFRAGMDEGHVSLKVQMTIRSIGAVRDWNLCWWPDQIDLEMYGSGLWTETGT